MIPLIAAFLTAEHSSSDALAAAWLALAVCTLSITILPFCSQRFEEFGEYLAVDLALWKVFVFVLPAWAILVGVVATILYFTCF